MNNNVQIAKKAIQAWESRDEKLMKEILHENYTCKSPGMEFNGIEEVLESMKNCPYKGSFANSELISENNKVVHSFDWVMTSPKLTIPMVEIMEMENGKIKNSKMYYDTALFPNECSSKECC